MSDAEVVDAIRRTHLKANISGHEHNGSRIHWDRAYVDHEGGFFARGPYLHVPVTTGDDEIVIRVYPPERLRKRLAKRLRPTPEDREETP